MNIAFLTLAVGLAFLAVLLRRLEVRWDGIVVTVGTAGMFWTIIIVLAALVLRR